MRTFFAMLQDSYREAVDGFVIYVMFILSGVLVVIAASMSFTPAEPDRAFRTIAGSLGMVMAEDGRGRMGFGGAQFQAADVRGEAGGYRLRLTVSANPTRQSFENGQMKADPAGGDSFRQLVISRQEMKKGGDRGFRTPNEDEQRAVTDAQMEEFVRGQLLDQAGLTATVTRVKEGVTYPTYAFDVTTTGGSSVKGWPHTTKIFFGAATLSDEAPLGTMLWGIEDVAINRVGGTLILMIGMIITASFIPNMLRKGSVDLLVTKPISRPELLVYKYIGGLTFVLLVTTVMVGGIWLALALRSGYWDTGFLWTIPILTFTFAVLYAVSTLVAVLTRNATAAMLMATGFAVFLFVVGLIKSEYESDLKRNPNEPRSAWASVIENGHDYLPRYRDLGVLNRHAIAEGTLPPGMYRMAVGVLGELPSRAEAYGISAAWIVALVGASCWWFGRRDY